MVDVGFTPPEVTQNTAINDKEVPHVVAASPLFTTERSGSKPRRLAAE